MLSEFTKPENVSNRFDINSHLDLLCKHKIISSEMAKTMRESAHDFSVDIDYKKYYVGGTYVPLDVAISFQADNEDRNVMIYFNNHRNENMDTRVCFKRY